MSVKSKTIMQIAIIVEDLDRVVDNFVNMFGVDRPESFYIPPTQTVPTFNSSIQEDCSDVKLAVLHFDGMVIEVAQPGSADTVFKRWLDKNGAGVHHFGFLVDEKNKDDALSSLSSMGCNLEHAGFYPNLTYTFIDGKKAFGIDFNIKWNTDNSEKIQKMLANPEAPLSDFLK